MPDQVRLGVGERVLDRVTDARLRGEVDHCAGVGRGGGLEGGMVSNVEFDEAETFPLRQQGEAVALEGDRVIVIEVVDPGNGDAQIKKCAGDMKADEARRTGQEDVLGSG